MSITLLRTQAGDVQQTAGILYQLAIQNPVRWLKQPGACETVRKCLAVFAAVVLSLSLIGIPVVVMGYREWNATVMPPRPGQQLSPELVSSPLVQKPAASVRTQPTQEFSDAERQAFCDALERSTRACALENECAERSLKIMDQRELYRKIIDAELVQVVRSNPQAHADIKKCHEAREKKQEVLNAVSCEIMDFIKSSANVEEAEQRMRQGLESLETLKNRHFVR